MRRCAGDGVASDGFPERVKDSILRPSLTLYQLSVGEFKALTNGQMVLPEGLRMTRAFTRRRKSTTMNPLADGGIRANLLAFENKGERVVKKIEPRSKEECITEMAEAFFAIDGDLRKVIRLEADNESDPDEPLKVLTVSEDVQETGFIGAGSPSRIRDGKRDPEIHTYELSLREFRALVAGELSLPAGLRMTKIFARPKSAEIGQKRNPTPRKAKVVA